MKRLFFGFLGEFSRWIFLYNNIPFKDNIFSRGGIVIHTISDKRLLMLRPKQIKISRKRQQFSETGEAMGQLADSISINGIIEPLCVRKREDGEYELISGFRRLQAARIAGLRRVPCVVHTASDADSEIYRLIENMQRKKPSFFEEAEALENIMQSYSISEKELAIRLGISQHAIITKLRLLKLSECQRIGITESGLSERQARSLIRLPERQRETVLEHIIKQGLNEKQTEKLVSDIYSKGNETKDEPQKPVRKYAIGDARLFYNSLIKLVSTLQNSGVNASCKKYENNKYIEYKVRINKEISDEVSAVQLKIC